MLIMEFRCVSDMEIFRGTYKDLQRHLIDEVGYVLEEDFNEDNYDEALDGYRLKLSIDVNGKIYQYQSTSNFSYGQHVPSMRNVNEVVMAISNKIAKDAGLGKHDTGSYIYSMEHFVSNSDW